MRVVSLLPAATETLRALGREPVAVSHACDVPPDAGPVPRVTDARVDADAASDEIHRQVLAAERAGGVYALDLAALRAADPDLVVTQGVCDVCAVDDVLARQAVERLDVDARVLTLDPHDLGDVLAAVERVGAAAGVGERAASLVADLRERVDAVAARAADARESPRTAVLDWVDPPMVAGHWVPELVSLAGGRPALVEPGSAGGPVAWDAVVAADPDVLVVAPCDLALDRAAEEARRLAARPGWDDLAAVRRGRAYAMDGHDHLNRPGPGLVDSLEHIAAILHPEEFEPPPADAVRPLAGPAEG